MYKILTEDSSYELSHFRGGLPDHGITIVRKIAEGLEVCFFGTTSDRPEVVNYYLNNLDLLQRFIVSFKDRAMDIINAANMQRLMPLMDKFTQINIVDSDLDAIKAMITREQFIAATQLKHYHLDDEFQGIVLSAREIEIVSHLLKGMTSEEIGKTIHLSVRTIEDYLSRLRTKFDASSKSQLVQKLLQADFISYLPRGKVQ